MNTDGPWTFATVIVLCQASRVESKTTVPDAC